jgi:ceramide glucosyltransferase
VSAAVVFLVTGVTAVVALVFSIVSNTWMRRAIARPAPSRPRDIRYPSLTIIRPIRGLDVDEPENLASVLEMDYPGEVETLLVLDSADDPAHPHACRVAERSPATRVIVAGAPPPGRTGKLNAMIVGVAAARGELIVFSDSDTQPDRHVVRLLVEALLDDDRAGVTFAPVVVHRAAQTAGDVGYALLINAWYGASVSLLRKDGALPFIMGQLMVWRRSAIDTIGGLAVADGQLVDDMFLGQKVTEAGLRNVMIDHPLRINTGGMRFGDYLRLMRRWFAFGRTGMPTRFAAFNGLRAVAFGLAFAAVVWALACGQPLAAIAPLVAAIAWAWGLLRLDRAFGGAPISLGHAWMALAVPLGAPLVVLSILVHRRVAWRGRSYELDAHTRLRESAR